MSDTNTSFSHSPYTALTSKHRTLPHQLRHPYSNPTPFPPLHQTQRRTATTNRNPTPSQFAKNASAAYTKQKQPEYQSKPREPPNPSKSTNSPSSNPSQSAQQQRGQAPSHPKPYTQTQSPRRASAPRTTPNGTDPTRQDFKTGASPAERSRLSPTEAFKRLLRSLVPTSSSSSSSVSSATSSTAETSTTSSNNPTTKTHYAYSVHRPHPARSKLTHDKSKSSSSSSSTSTTSNPTMTEAQAARLAIRQRLGYDAVARRILAAMVAAPVAIVTSYFLYKRVVLGEERKRFPSSPGDPDTRELGRPRGARGEV